MGGGFGSSCPLTVSLPETRPVRIGSWCSVFSCLCGRAAPLLVVVALQVHACFGRRMLGGSVDRVWHDRPPHPEEDAVARRGIGDSAAHLDDLCDL